MQELGRILGIQLPDDLLNQLLPTGPLAFPWILTHADVVICTSLDEQQDFEKNRIKSLQGT